MRISDWSSDVCSSDLLFQRIDMGGGEVADMDIVAHPGSVGRVVIGAVDGDVAALADRGLYGDLDQMRGTGGGLAGRSEEHTSELQSLMRISYAVFCLKKKKQESVLIHPNATQVTS